MRPPLPVFGTQDTLVFAQPTNLGRARLVESPDPKLVAFGVALNTSVKPAAEDDLLKEEEVDLPVSVINGSA